MPVDRIRKIKKRSFSETEIGERSLLFDRKFQKNFLLDKRHCEPEMHIFSIEELHLYAKKRSCQDQDRQKKENYENDQKDKSRR